ncbi:ABC transporter substrate-binding protein [Roseivirga seohaensis]|uniref:ABC transporter substrate-binding protein n=1 Tax=Roseivirga seohaensis TaxID=1914963 RepID=UPI003BA8A3E8
MVELKIGGVPEHFNMPWQLLLASGILEKSGITPSWTDYHGGTGLLAQALHDGDLDIGILLTEGAVQGIDKGKTFKIFSFYVDSSLTWGIHVPANSHCKNVADIQGKRYAISRFGSGSHLMAIIDAKARGWSTEDIKFEVIDNLVGARESFKYGDSDVFFWEKFTTKSLVDSGEFRRVGERKTPFSCFVICVSDKAFQEKREAVLTTINALFQQVNQFMASADKVKLISDFYNLKTEDVEAWLKDVSWAPRPHLNPAMLQTTIDTLKGLNLVSENLKVDHLVGPMESLEK